MKKEKKLTSVHVLSDVYEKFKDLTIDSSINLQKLVNRSLDLYIKNDEFKKTINNHTDLTSTGSKY